MKYTMRIKGFAAVALAAGVLTLPVTLVAQQNIEPSHSAGQPTNSMPAASYTQEQLLTATVHQAWLLSGKNEDNFFNMVQQLAEISAKNREITLPESAAAGRRMGNYIKLQAKADTDQLLYAVVDKAVVMVAHVPAHPAGQASKPQPVPPTSK